MLTLGAPVWVFGLATALAYGPGSLVAYVGGRIADVVGRKRIALLGNSLIPLLAFTGLATSAVPAVALFAGGWWARNFRRGPRRAMLTEVVPPAHRGRAFGLLHAFDVVGGMVAAVLVVLLLTLHVPLRTIFLLALVPLVASTACLAAVRAGAAAPAAKPQPRPQPVNDGATRLYRGIVASAFLFGFSSYSLGFPILTIAQGTRNAGLGVLAYALFQGVSALSALGIGRRKDAGAGALALLGYLIACLGSLGLAASFAWHLGAPGFYGAMVVLGLAIGVIETLEPTVISKVTPAAHAGGGMGALTAARSLGLLVGNLGMALLYQIGPVYAYGYAAMGAVAAGVVLLVWSRTAPSLRGDIGAATAR